MATIKELRNQYLKEYDRMNKEIDMHNRIIESYREQWRRVQSEPRPLTLNDSYIEQYVNIEFQTYRRIYERKYNDFKIYREWLSVKIAAINANLGYDLDDLDSDEE